VKNVLQHCGQGFALSVHVNGNAADTGGLNGTVVTRNDVHGGRKGGVVVEPIVVCAHVLQGTRVDDPTGLETLRTRIDLGL